MGNDTCQCLCGKLRVLGTLGVLRVLVYNIIQNLSHSIIFNLAFSSSSLDTLLFLGELKLFSNEIVSSEGE